MPEALIIRDVTLIDGGGAAPVERAAILIEGERISAVGKADDVEEPDGAAGIDGSGLWAVPGLIDTHVHLALVGAMSLPVFLAMGVTTIRDLGVAELAFLADMRRSLEDGAVGPRLLFSGPMIDGAPPTFPGIIRSTASPEDAATAVREHLDAGVDAIKLYATLPPDSVRRCIQEVDGRVPVTGHLGRTLASDAIDAGIDGLEHALLTPYNDLAPEELRTAPGEVMMSLGFWQKIYGGWLRTDLASERTQRWIERLVEHDVSFCPTLTVVPGADEPHEDELRYAVGLIERLDDRARERGQQRASQAQELPQRVRVRLQELVGRVHEVGGRVIAGTDGGVLRMAPGFALHHELALLSGAGLSNMAVLRAATARAAEALWRDDLGTIEVGKQADLLLLRRNPLADLSALRDIHRVIHGGRVFDPAELLAEAGRED